MSGLCSVISVMHREYKVCRTVLLLVQSHLYIPVHHLFSDSCARPSLPFIFYVVFVFMCFVFVLLFC